MKLVDDLKSLQIFWLGGFCNIFIHQPNNWIGLFLRLYVLYNAGIVNKRVKNAFDL